MRVGLNLQYLVPGETGGRETYARELVPAMLELEPQLELIAFVNRDAGARVVAELAPGIRAVTLPISARSRPQWAISELALVALAASRARVELLHSMANFGPAWGPFHRVLTIHDLQYRSLPEATPGLSRAATHAMIWTAAHRADRIIAVSQVGREEIATGLGVQRERIDVIPNGVRPPAGSVASQPPHAHARALVHHTEGRRPVALAVATNLPHKNLPILIDALTLIDPGQRPLLVFAGFGTDDGSLERAAASAGVADDVVAVGACSTAEIEWLYEHAGCLVLPTLHEGFGLPVLEALARSLPVACSDIRALREVAGEQALYFDPRSPQAVAAALVRVLTDVPLRQRLSEQGPQRASLFSWVNAADATLTCYRRALRTAE